VSQVGHLTVRTDINNLPGNKQVAHYNTACRSATEASSG
jgi:hypothetical protein